MPNERRLQFAGLGSKWKRDYMEDFFIATVLNTEEHPVDTTYARSASKEEIAYFAVFDGHLGDFTSRHCSIHLLDNITKTSDFKCGDICSAIRLGFADTENYMKLQKITSGSTAVCAFVTRDKIYTANLGDSRAVLCRGGAPVMVTKDHTAADPEELQRIKDAGGFVLYGRINGQMIPSGTIGDIDMKEQKNADSDHEIIRSNPDIYVEDREGAEFMVLASDGVWECASVEQVCGLVRHYLTVTRNMDKICRAVIDHCKWSGKTNKSMSAVVVAFEAAPEVSAESAQRDAEFEEQLRRRIADIVEEDEYTTFYKVMALLLKNVEAPEGSSVGSKRSFVKNVLKCMRE